MITIAMQKSVSPTQTDASGRMMRGKYTFVSSRWLLTMLLLDSVSENAKSCQGSSAQKANTGYGIDPVSIPASLPKNTLKTTIVSTGCTTAQATPSAVCL